MTQSARAQRRVAVVVSLVSAAAWLTLLVNPWGVVPVEYCTPASGGVSPSSWQLLLTLNPPSALAAGWVLMLFAMMAPTLAAPLHHVLVRNFAHRRAWSVALFALSYAVVWLVAGVALITVELTLSALAPLSYLPALAAALVAVVWQCAPLKQRCLNRAHNHSELRAYGRGADLDVLRFGLKHGLWCVASCWALMLFPMLLPHGHTPAMLAVTFVMISERLEDPQPPSWRIRGPGKLARAIFAQAQIAYQRLRANTAAASS